MSASRGELPPTVGASRSKSSRGRRPTRLLVALAFVGFISLGLPDGLLGVAWPSIRQTFGIPFDALGPLLLAIVVGYLVASANSGWLVDRLGLGRLLALSSLATAIGLLGYALAPAWSVMVALGLAAGLGAGAIDAGLNAYVAVNHGPRFLNLLHACYGVGAATGPAIMAAILGAGLSWRWGYVIVGTLQMGLGICFLLTARSWATTRETAPATSPTVPAEPTTPIWRQPLVWLSLLLFFLYTGVEVTAGEWSYSVFTEARDVSSQVSALGVSVYWANLTIGRLLAGIVADRVGPVILLRTSIFGVVVGAALTWLNLSVELSVVGLGLVGLAAAPIFPSLIASTPGRLGAERAPRVIGLQVGAAALGGALLPGLAGVLAEQLGLEAIVALLVIGAVGMALLHEALVASAR